MGPGMEGHSTAGWYEQGFWTQTQELNAGSVSSSDQRPSVSVLVCTLGAAGCPAGPGPDPQYAPRPLHSALTAMNLAPVDPWLGVESQGGRAGLGRGSTWGVRLP